MDNPTHCFQFWAVNEVQNGHRQNINTDLEKKNLAVHQNNDDLKLAELYAEAAFE